MPARTKAELLGDLNIQSNSPVERQTLANIVRSFSRSGLEDELPLPKIPLTQFNKPGGGELKGEGSLQRKGHQLNGKGKAASTIGLPPNYTKGGKLVVAVRAKGKGDLGVSANLLGDTEAEIIVENEKQQLSEESKEYEFGLNSIGVGAW